MRDTMRGDQWIELPQGWYFRPCDDVAHVELCRPDGQAGCKLRTADARAFAEAMRRK